MSCKTIDQLPDELLIQMFEFLDSNSILNAALVCKRWDGIIGSTAAIMNKFVLVMNRRSHVNPGFFPEVSRKVIRMQFDFMSPDRTVCLAFSRWNNSRMNTLTSIDFDSCTLDSALLVRMLNAAESLTTLIFKEGRLVGGLEEKLSFSDKLSSITYHGNMSNLKFFEIIKSCQVRTLDVHLEHHETVVDLSNFIATQERLKVLSIQFTQDELLHSFLDLTNGKAQAAYKLRKLSLKSKKWSMDASEELQKNLLKFLQPHETTLQELEMRVQLSPKLLRRLLTRLVSLKTLSLYVDKIINDESFYKQLGPVSTVTKLTIVDDFLDSNTERHFLELFPNLEVLSVKTNKEYTLRLIEEKMHRLKDLAIWALPAQVYGRPLIMKFPALQVIQISRLESSENLRTLFENNPSIERVHFNCALWPSGFKNSTVSAVTHAANVRYIKVHGFDLDIKEFYDAFEQVGYTNLAYLEVQDSASKATNASFYNLKM